MLVWVASEPTAITVVPAAARIVIFVVANAVSLELGENASTLDA